MSQFIWKLFRYIVYICRVGIIIGTRSLLFQVFPALTVLSVCVLAFAGSPLFVLDPKLSAALPGLLMYNAEDEARENEREVNALFERNENSYKWLIRLRTVIGFVNNSRLLQFLYNALVLSESFLILVFDETITVWILLVFALMFPFVMTSALQYVVFFGKAIDLRDEDFAASVDGPGYYCYWRDLICAGWYECIVLWFWCCSHVCSMFYRCRLSLRICCVSVGAFVVGNVQWSVFCFSYIVHCGRTECVRRLNDSIHYLDRIESISLSYVQLLVSYVYTSLLALLLRLYPMRLDPSGANSNVTAPEIVVIDDSGGNEGLVVDFEPREMPIVDDEGIKSAVAKSEQEADEFDEEEEVWVNHSKGSSEKSSVHNEDEEEQELISNLSDVTYDTEGGWRWKSEVSEEDDQNEEDGDSVDYSEVSFNSHKGWHYKYDQEED